MKDSCNELDNLIICHRCHSVHKKTVLPSKKVARCSVCKSKLYSNVKDVFTKAVAFSLTSLILFIVANLFPIIRVFIGGQESDLTIPGMIEILFSEGFYVVGSIVLVVIVIAPLIVIFSYLSLWFLTKFRIFKNFSKHIISFLIVSRHWAMVDIFAVSILVALVKLFGYASVNFGVSAFALLLYVLVDLFALKTIKPVELWTYFNRAYCEEDR